MKNIIFQRLGALVLSALVGVLMILSTTLSASAQVVVDDGYVTYTSKNFSGTRPFSVNYRYQGDLLWIRNNDQDDLEDYSDYPSENYSVELVKDGNTIFEDQSTVFSFYQIPLASDGDYTIKVLTKNTNDTEYSVYDEIDFNFVRANYPTIPDSDGDYKVKIIQKIDDGSLTAPTLSNRYYYNEKPSPRSHPRSVAIEGDGEEEFTTFQTYGGGSVAYYVLEGNFTFSTTYNNYHESWPVDERRSNGWGIKSISGEYCGQDGSYEAGPGKDVECTYTYDYQQPYPDVLAASTHDEHVVRTIIVNGGDRTAQDISDAASYNWGVSSVYGGELPTDDITQGDAKRTVGRYVSACGGGGCSFSGASGGFTPPTFDDYELSISGTNCTDEGRYTSGEGVGLTECVFTYDYIGSDDVDVPTIDAEVTIVGGPLRLEDVTLEHRCGNSDEEVEYTLDGDGKVSVEPCGIGANFSNTGYFGEYLYGQSDTATYLNNYSVTRTGENCDYGSYDIVRGYDGEEAENAVCEITMTHTGRFNVDPNPDDTCVVTSTTQASGGIWGWDYGKAAGCHLNPGSDDDDDENIEEEAGECIDHDGDGWGWDGEKGCQVGSDTDEDEMEETTECIDHDGDGWGWDGEKGCQVSDETDPVGDEREQCIADGKLWNSFLGECFDIDDEEEVYECIDHDGDGWGWDGEKGCQISSGDSKREQCIDAGGVWNTQQQKCFDANEEETYECIDHDGDGWGWDGEKGCQIDSDNQEEEEEEETRCIDHDGDGWGWDGEKGCQV